MIKLRDIYTISKLGLGLLVRRIPKFPIIAAFEVTSRCTLKCRHCYWWRDKSGRELNDNEFYTKIVEIKKIYPTLISAVWLGGEPLLRTDLVDRCKSLFSFNEVITNGTLPLPSWKNVRFACSVDGTEKYDEAQRGKNTYKKVKQNIDRPDINVNINCVITKINQVCIEEFVEEWRQTHIRSIGFSFYTPIGSEDDKSIWLTFEERDKVIGRLLKLKKKYPDFINSSTQVLNNFKSENCRQITERCRRDYAPFNSLCFDFAMVRKFPCIIGKNADCERCGCTASMFAESIRQGESSFLNQHLRSALNW